MTMIQEPTHRSANSSRESLLTRVLGFVDGRVHRPRPNNAPSVAEPQVYRPSSSALENFRPNLEPHRPDDEAGYTHQVESRLYLEARDQIKRRAWGRAQRLLEQLSRDEPDSPAPLDLQSIRALRRSLRHAARWPSDPDAHLELGRAYFDLDLGDEALAEFRLLVRLAPGRPEGYVLSALEYIYRGQYPRAIAAWTQARTLQADLPPLEDLLAELPN